MLRAVLSSCKADREIDDLLCVQSDAVDNDDKGGEYSDEGSNNSSADISDQFSTSLGYRGRVRESAAAIQSRRAMQRNLNWGILCFENGAS